MNAFWKLWWFLSHAEAGTKKDKLGLNILLLISGIFYTMF